MVAADLSLARVRALRMHALLLSGDRGLGLGLRGRAGAEGAVARVVEWMGAMQAQDLASVLWSLGLRLPGETAATVEAALDRGEAIRTWPMRGTLHLVPARDAAWMVELLSARPIAAGVPVRASLGLSVEESDRGVEVIRDALTRSGTATRDALASELAEAGVETAGQAAYHLLAYAAQRGVICLAGRIDGAQAFALLEDRVPDPHRPSREEALATLALRFVRSHGPVTAADLARWAGLSLGEARAAIADAGDAIAAVATAAGPMLVAPEALDAALPNASREILVVPGYDELVLGYGDRSAQLDPASERAVEPGGNGVFRATIVRGGRVVGTWRRQLRARQVAIEVTALEGLPAREHARVERAFEPYGSFLGLEPRISWV